jgi:hypothetical protein
MSMAKVKIRIPSGRVERRILRTIRDLEDDSGYVNAAAVEREASLPCRSGSKWPEVFKRSCWQLHDRGLLLVGIRVVVMIVDHGVDPKMFGKRTKDFLERFPLAVLQLTETGREAAARISD